MTFIISNLESTKFNGMKILFWLIENLGIMTRSRVKNLKLKFSGLFLCSTSEMTGTAFILTILAFLDFLNEIELIFIKKKFLIENKCHSSMVGSGEDDTCGVGISNSPEVFNGNIQDYKNLTLIGKGQYGEVFSSEKSGISYKKYAIKKTRVFGEGLSSSTLREVSIMKNLKNDFIAR